jgi:hypothetical protein
MAPAADGWGARFSGVILHWMRLARMQLETVRLGWRSGAIEGPRRR